MRLREIHASHIPPVEQFNADELSDVVVLAGPNGVGKTRFIGTLLAYIQAPGNFPGTVEGQPRIRLVLESTNPTETSEWGKSILDTQDPQDIGRLTRTLQKTRRRSKWESSVLNFESDRSIQQVVALPPSWETLDPWIENIPWTFGFGGLRNRFQDTVHSLIKKARSRREAIMSRVEELMQPRANRAPAPPNLFEQLEAQFPDPAEPFQRAFSQLLAPKSLLAPDPKNQDFIRWGARAFLSPASARESER
jgi:hypothetical protein